MSTNETVYPHLRENELIRDLNQNITKNFVKKKNFKLLRKLKNRM